MAPPGLSEEFLRNDLTVVGSLAGGGDLGEVDLVYVQPDLDFVDETLTNSDFSGSSLSGARFDNATLFGAKLIDADLRRTSFVGATLIGADFRNANITNATFFGAELTDALFSDVVVKYADFGRTTGSGFTAAQLYSTGSYSDNDLVGLGLSANDLILQR